MARVCIITTGQPSTNPRALKEADALAQSGHEVRLIDTYWVRWAVEFDKKLQREAAWTSERVGGSPESAKLAYYLTRLRHGVARRLLNIFPQSPRVQNLSLCRAATELKKSAESFAADLYIAHYPGALPAAVAGADRNHALVGYDAEDFYSKPSDGGADTFLAAIEDCERRYLPRCCYVTASSPGIATAYSLRYSKCIPSDPVVLFNTFPLSYRPNFFRSTSLEGPIRLYWFSQTIGRFRGLEDIVKAMGSIRDVPIELHLRGIWQPGYKEEFYHAVERADVPLLRVISHDPADPAEMAREAAKYDVGLALEPMTGTNANICISNKIFTYLLAGNAIIATATDGQRFVFDSLSNGGLCFQPGDALAVAAQLKVWSENRAALDAVRRSNWDCGANMYNWDAEKLKFLDLIDTVLSGKSAPVKGHIHAALS
jgi:glycosyltransferase involved in cell wall biosynthesis